MTPKTTLAGIVELIVKDSSCQNYTRWFWSFRLQNGRPYLVVYSADKKGQITKDVGELIGWVENITLCKLSEDNNYPKDDRKLSQCIIFSTFDEESNKRAKCMVQVGNCLDGEMVDIKDFGALKSDDWRDGPKIVSM